MHTLLALGISLLAAAAHANPCDSIDRSLSDEQKPRLSAELSRQLELSRVKVLQSLRSDPWLILYISAKDAENAYVFFSDDPLKKRYVTIWGGFALPEEQAEIETWTRKNAPGIPVTLAACFARQATQAQAE